MFVRLNVKLAEILNGVDLSHCAEGDVLQMSERDGSMLLAEGWAERVADDELVSGDSAALARDVAADTGPPRSPKAARKAPLTPRA